MDDYGYFGKGTEGYIHYTEAVKRSSGGGGGGGKGGGGGTTLITVLMIIGLMALIGSCLPD